MSTVKKQVMEDQIEYSGNSYERMDGESDRAFLAFTCYKNLGLSRTIDAAYNAYLAQCNNTETAGNGRKKEPSPTFKKWMKEYRWQERCADWDAFQEKVFRESLLEQDLEAYCSGLESYRKRSLRLADNQLLSIEALMQLAKKAISDLARSATPDPEAIIQLCRIQKEIAAVSTGIDQRYQNAYSIKLVVQQMTEPMGDDDSSDGD